MTDTPNRTGDTVKQADDYQATCCKHEVKLTDGDQFPRCPEHGDTEWRVCTPTDWMPRPGDRPDLPPTNPMARRPHLPPNN